uniref:Uncharacterized protein n=1 Tax=Arundo donax TaxID=35708 RepID=A0A0A9B9Y9_ARUDO
MEDTLLGFVHSHLGIVSVSMEDTLLGLVSSLEEPFQVSF